MATAAHGDGGSGCGRGLRGVVTDEHIEQAEAVFPGIRRFFESCDEKPQTFLELVWRFENRIRRPA